MDFSEAVKALKEGSAIRRRSWTPLVYIGWCYHTYDDGTKSQELAEFRQETVPFFYDNKIIVSEDWEIVGDENYFLSFPDAIDKMMRGCKIKLVTWPKNTWIQLSENQREIIMKRMCQHPFNIDLDGFAANDWELAE